MKTVSQGLSGQLLSEQEVTTKPGSISVSHPDAIMSHVHTDSNGFSSYILAALPTESHGGKCSSDTHLFPGEYTQFATKEAFFFKCMMPCLHNLLKRPQWVWEKQIPLLSGVPGFLMTKTKIVTSVGIPSVPQAQPPKSDRGCLSLTEDNCKNSRRHCCGQDALFPFPQL